MDETWMPRCVRLNRLELEKIERDKRIIETITQEISPEGNSNKQERITALLSYIALGGSLLSLGGIFYLYFNGAPVPPECMDDSTYNKIIENCNKLFTMYWKGEDKTSCELDIDKFNRDSATYYDGLQYLINTFVLTSFVTGATKIVQVSKWVKKRFSESMCTVQGGRRTYRKKRKSRRYANKRKSRRHATKKKLHRK